MVRVNPNSIDCKRSFELPQNLGTHIGYAIGTGLLLTTVGLYGLNSNTVNAAYFEGDTDSNTNIVLKSTLEQKVVENSNNYSTWSLDHDGEGGYNGGYLTLIDNKAHFITSDTELYAADLENYLAFTKENIVNKADYINNRQKAIDIKNQIE